MGEPPGSTSPEPDGVLEAGRVGRAHGLDGSFYVTRALASVLVLGTDVRLGGLSSTIERRAGTDARPIIRLAGVKDRRGAEALRGEPLLVARASVPPLEPDEYWAHELEGCTVLADSGPVGVVVSLMVLPSCEALQVSRPDGSELLVPLVSDAIEEIDAPQRRIRVNLRFLGVES